MMEKIQETDDPAFHENLLATQIYCDQQLLNCEKNPAAIFRSINPVRNGKKLFEFKIDDYGFEAETRYSFSTEWTKDPFRDEDSDLFFNELFDFQLLQKRENVKGVISGKAFKGRILIVAIDDTVIDGASEVCSEGLIDVYDCPPIDTWFYLTNNPMGRLLFAWIPREFAYQANEAINVNCVDCIRWLQGQVPEVEKAEQDPTLVVKKTFFERIRQLFQ